MVCIVTPLKGYIRLAMQHVWQFIRCIDLVDRGNQKRIQQIEGKNKSSTETRAESRDMMYPKNNIVFIYFLTSRTMERYMIVQSHT